MKPPVSQNESMVNAEEEVYKNPFVRNQILFQNLIKIGLHFAAVTIRINFKNEISNEITNQDQFEFICEVVILEGKRWRHEIQLSFKQFSKIVTSFKLELKDFMLHAGFWDWQKRHLAKYIKENVTIEESRLSVKPEIFQPPRLFVKEKINITFNSLSALYDRRKTLPNQNIPFFEIEEEIPDVANQINLQSQRGMPRRSNTVVLRPIHMFSTKKLRRSPSDVPEDNFHIRVYNPTDAEYGVPGNCVDKIGVVGIGASMKYYNTFHEIEPRRYYIQLDKKSEKVLLRLDYFKSEPESKMIIGIYHYGSNNLDFLEITDQRMQERIINIFELDTEEMRQNTLNNLFDFDRFLVGKKLTLKDKWALGRYNKKFDITPLNISQILMTNGDENLPKYKLDIQNNFTKGYIENLGDCYISVKTYFIKSLYKFDNIFCIKFEITPFYSKTKFYKFLINSKDIKVFLGKDYPSESPYQNWEVIKFIINSLVLKRQMVYHSIELPIKNARFMAIQKHEYNLRNIIAQSIESLSIGSNIIFGHFLAPKIQESKIILQCTRKINKTYVLITVEKHIVLDHWTFILYVPKSSRKFVTSIYSSDIHALNPAFLENLYSVAATKIESNKKNLADYSKFNSEYQRVTKNEQLELSKMNSLTRSSLSYNEQEINNLITQEKVKKRNSSKDQSSFDDTKQKFIELKFWENVIQNLQLFKTKKDNYLLVLDNFRGVLREYIYRDIVQTSPNEEALIEIYLENTYKHYDLLGDLPQIPEIYVENHDIFARTTSLSRMNTYNNRFNLENVIKLYNEENLVQKVQMLNQKKKLPLARIKLLARYMIYKVKSWNLLEVSKDQFDKTKSLNKEIQLPWNNYSLKLNCNFDIMQRIDDKHMFIDKILIYRGVLTLAPLQLTSIVYNEKKDDVVMYVYDVAGSRRLKKVIRMEDVVANVPYAKTMLKQRLHHEVGDKIFRSFKNTMIIYSFLHQKKVV